MHVLTFSAAVAAHCGKAFKMAFTSSATAVSANSNWSWWGRAGERQRWREGTEAWEVWKGWLEIGQRETVGLWRPSTFKVLKYCKTQIDGTLVRTKPGLWSLMCSNEAAMSISFTPNNNRDSKSVTITVCELCFLFLVQRSFSLNLKAKKFMNFIN